VQLEFLGENIEHEQGIAVFVLCLLGGFAIDSTDEPAGQVIGTEENGQTKKQNPDQKTEAVVQNLESTSALPKSTNQECAEIESGPPLPEQPKERYEYNSIYRKLPQTKDGVEVVPPLPSTTSPMPRRVPLSKAEKNLIPRDDRVIHIGRGDRDDSEPLYYGGVLPTPDCPLPNGSGGGPPSSLTTLRHIPVEHPNRLVTVLLTWFPEGYVVELVLDAMRQLHGKEAYGPKVTEWITRQLAEKYLPLE
jgi:hypothetical protein